MPGEASAPVFGDLATRSGDAPESRGDFFGDGNGAATAGGLGAATATGLAAATGLATTGGATVMGMGTMPPGDVATGAATIWGAATICGAATIPGDICGAPGGDETHDPAAGPAQPGGGPTT